MKKVITKLSLIALMAHGVPLVALAPADVSRLEQQVRTALAAEDVIQARLLIDQLEGAGARSVAQPLRTQLESALKKQAINESAFERLYRNVADREKKQLERARAELQNQLQNVKADLLRAREEAGVQQRGVSDVRVALKKQEEANLRLQSDLRKVQAERDAYQNRVNDLEAGNQDFQRQLDAARKQLKANQDYINQANQDTDAIEKDLEAARKEIADLQQQVNDYRSIQKTLQSKATEFSNKLQNVKAYITEQGLKQLITDYDNGRNPLAINTFVNTFRGLFN
ncbi:hypothetical protein Noda2021_11010 [Candidatus Dependentiae bacterium Noda2021]|nr:hypothetical protein Noda2021_11010 [Candidatus Dependentiae bacterium Noda2021]